MLTHLPSLLCVLFSQVLAIQMDPVPLRSTADAAARAASAPGQDIMLSKAQRVFDLADHMHHGALDKEQLMGALKAMGTSLPAHACLNLCVTLGHVPLAASQFQATCPVACHAGCGYVDPCTCL